VLSSAGKIVSIDGDAAETEIAGVRRRVSIALTPEAKVEITYCFIRDMP